jgi:hypothetical protein
MSDEYWGETYGRGIDYDIPCDECGETYETETEARECCEVKQ